MGADLCLGILTWDTDEKLKWKDGFEIIKNLEENENGFVEDNGCLTKQILKDKLTELKSVIDNDNRRDAYLMEIGSMKILLTGGMSWGDSPTELLDDINDLTEVEELLSAVGFNKPQPDYKAILLKNPSILPTLLGLDKRLDEIIAEKIGK